MKKQLLLLCAMVLAVVANAQTSMSASDTFTPDCVLPTTEFSGVTDAEVDRSTMTATATPAGHSTAEAIDKSLDNNLNTFYHSNYSIAVNENAPAVLTYTLPATSRFNAVRYTPRPGGGNGDFGLVEVYYKQTAGGAEQYLTSFDCNFSNTASLIKLGQNLVDANQLIIRVKTAEGGFASCSEMEFVNLGLQALNQYPNIFQNLHSELKPGIGQADIDGISSPYYKALAQCLLNGNQTYNKRFRLMTATPYPTIGSVRNKLRIMGACTVENPTGIVFKAGTQAVIFVDEVSVDLRLHTANFAGENTLDHTYYPLSAGLNVINITKDGLGYIDYFTNVTSALPVKLNITTGDVNGYYDAANDTDADWQAMLTNNVYPKLDVKGTYINLNLHKKALLNLSHLSGKALVDGHDKIVKTEYELMGLFKYNIVPKNHMFLYTPIGGGLYASAFGAHIGINANTNLDYNDLIGRSLWGRAHELGHINQVRPAFKWHGMTEVTNNLYSAYCQYLFGTAFPNSTRYEREGLNGPMSTVYYPSVIAAQYNAGIQLGKIRAQSLYEVITDNDRAACRVATLPFWQLLLYYSEAGALKGLPTLQQRLGGVPAPVGQADVGYWLGDFLEICRNANTSGVSDVQLMLNAIVNICDVVKEDLSDFFINAGYLRVVDKDVDDYGVKRITLTQQQIDQTVALIKSKNYPEPVSPVLNYLSTNSLEIFKSKATVSGQPTVGVTLNTNANPELTTITINASDWQNAVAFETYAQKTLVDVAVLGTADATVNTSRVRYPTNATSVYAVGYDGTRKLVYPATDQFDVLPVILVGFNAKKTANGALLSWSTASEKNNAKFEIYKKTGNGNFVKIGEKTANETTNKQTSYQYLDKTFSEDAYYYLKQVDQNGVATAYDQSEWVRFVVADLTSKATLVYPNPATSSFKVKASAKYYQVKLVDLNGRVLHTVNGTDNTGVSINISHLPTGVYLVQVISDAGVETKKLVKN